MPPSAALIWPYHRGIQVPAGFVADRIGGPTVMLAGLALWSCFTGLMPLARAMPPSRQLLVLMLLRALLGLSQSVILPSTSAAVSRCEPELFRHVACCGLQDGRAPSAASGMGRLGLLQCKPQSACNSSAPRHVDPVTLQSAHGGVK